MKLGNAATGAGIGGVVILLLLFVLVLGPFLLFWSLGVLFGIQIALTPKTWLAAVVFLALVRGSCTSSK